jgi:hypothetical protein
MAQKVLSLVELFLGIAQDRDKWSENQPDGEVNNEADGAEKDEKATELENLVGLSNDL